MKRVVRRYLLGECGAVTTDWVVLTASIAFLAVATVSTVKAGLVEIGPAISAEIDNQMPS